MALPDLAVRLQRLSASLYSFDREPGTMTATDALARLQPLQDDINAYVAPRRFQEGSNNLSKRPRMDASMAGPRKSFLILAIQGLKPSTTLPFSSDLTLTHNPKIMGRLEKSLLPRLPSGRPRLSSQGEAYKEAIRLGTERYKSRRSTSNPRGFPTPRQRIGS